jgi:cysteine dioxygenase
MLPLMLPASATSATIDKGSATPYRRFKERYNLGELVQDIKEHLGHSGGISSEDVDSDYLRSLLEKYISDPSDWIQYFNNDRSKNYTRNVIENINHKANIVSIYSFLKYPTRLIIVASSCVEPRKRISDP